MMGGRKLSGSPSQGSPRNEEQTPGDEEGAQARGSHLQPARGGEHRRAPPKGSWMQRQAVKTHPHRASPFILEPELSSYFQWGREGIKLKCGSFLWPEICKHSI